MLVASSDFRPEMLLNNLQCTGQSSPQRMMQLQSHTAVVERCCASTMENSIELPRKTKHRVTM